MKRSRFTEEQIITILRNGAGSARNGCAPLRARHTRLFKREFVSTGS